ncbi:MAG: hypothetical protein H8E10_04300 [Desulfobacterales bacterium]|jgi:arsenate reductase-like glutaredoxin family protein|nr:hypothetical protein [Desulfobacterales bacterium]
MERFGDWFPGVLSIESLNVLKHGQVGKEYLLEKLVRKGEAIHKGKFKSLKLNEHEWVKVRHENFVHIKRPILVKDHRAVIGHPPDKVLELL